MGQDTEELKRKIENTRADMSNTIEAIGDRVSPSRVAERSKNKVIVGAQSIREKVMGVAGDAQDKLSGTAEHAGDAMHHAPVAVAERTQGAPMVTGAVAFGLGFLVAAAFPASAKEKQLSSKVMDTLEPVQDKLVESAHEVAANLKAPAMEAAQTLKDVAKDGAETVAEVAKEGVADTTAQAHPTTAPSEDADMTPPSMPLPGGSTPIV